jgi:hypothetical protein
MFAALVGGLVDQVLSRIVDALMSVPELIFILMILSILGGSILNLILIIAVLTSTRFYRISRAAALNVASLDFVEAARARGEGSLWIAVNEILPNILPLILSELGMRFCFIFLNIAALSFLGVGIQPPTGGMGVDGARQCRADQHGQRHPADPGRRHRAVGHRGELCRRLDAEPGQRPVRRGLSMPDPVIRIDNLHIDRGESQ